MQHAALTDFARQLLAIHGERASAEAAQHKLICENSGDRKTAGIWRELETVLVTVSRESCH